MAKELLVLTSEWTEKNQVECNYQEAQVMMEFLINHQTDFKLTFPSEDNEDLMVISRNYKLPKDFDVILSLARVLGELQVDEFNEADGDTSEMIGFESESGTWVINPFVSECQRFSENPVEYYGQSFLSSDFTNIDIMIDRIKQMREGK